VIWVGPKREMIMLVRRHRQRWYALMCIGRKRHYRKDGTCPHTDAILKRVRPKFRKLVKVDPWGGKTMRDIRGPDQPAGDV
jgi:hypothetical protein